MSPNGPNEYLRTKVMTASQEQLQLMLYDGAIRFASQGRDALTSGGFEASCEKILRAQKIVMEMNAALRFDVDPRLCQRLSSLYTYIYRRLVKANIEHDIEALDEAVELLHYQRQTWTMVMDKLVEGRSQAQSPTPQLESAPGEPVSVDVAV